MPGASVSVRWVTVPAACSPLNRPPGLRAINRLQPVTADELVFALREDL